MLAKDIMTTDVAFVTANAHVGDVARLLVERGISAVPVVDAEHRPIGMISESDLIGSDELSRDERRQWWLALLAEGHPLDPGFLETIERNGRIAEELMNSPVVCVEDSTDVSEVAQLIERYKYKRAPVLRHGRMVGIVSRADLVRAIALEHQVRPPPEWLTGRRRRVLEKSEPPPAIERLFPIVPEPMEPLPADATAQDFRALAEKHEAQENHLRLERRRLEREMTKRRVEELAQRRLSDKDWRHLLEKARQTAAAGMNEFMLIRFPSQLCVDGGRAINAPDPDWPDTLRGEPADVFNRWRVELRPRGFRLAAQIIEFPDGIPGDAALFLIWG
jgi:CBS domain-containing protein